MKEKNIGFEIEADISIQEFPELEFEEMVKQARARIQAEFEKELVELKAKREKLEEGE